jgi:hypothetical protein
LYSPVSGWSAKKASTGRQEDAHVEAHLTDV